ncbi:hypothetical protein WR25_13238 [Diploscapter pachys]|uniref:Uncharacterized protein n=1 Tax=Diploscapter pachys TaxID=2018661 RepID=A0A2A2K341_9BILA|nr:hypothetical protein WR25_13238 [Diploscapter pachys]
MLRCAIVPDRHVSRLPAPSHRVLRLGDLILKDLEDAIGILPIEADEMLDEIAEQQRLLAGHRMDVNHRMFGFVDGGSEDLAMTSDGLRGRLGPGGGIVIGVGVDRAQTLDQRLERRGQPFIGGDRIRPEGVAARGRDHQRAQDRRGGEGGQEGDVRMPLRRGLTLTRVEFEQEARPLRHRHGRASTGTVAARASSARRIWAWRVWSSGKCQISAAEMMCAAAGPSAKTYLSASSAAGALCPLGWKPSQASKGSARPMPIAGPALVARLKTEKNRPVRLWPVDSSCASATSATIARSIRLPEPCVSPCATASAISSQSISGKTASRAMLIAACASSPAIAVSRLPSRRPIASQIGPAATPNTNCSRYSPLAHCGRPM